jgi:hypothetical protein
MNKRAQIGSGITSFAVLFVVFLIMALFVFISAGVGSMIAPRGNVVVQTGEFRLPSDYSPLFTIVPMEKNGEMHYDRPIDLFLEEYAVLDKKLDTKKIGSSCVPETGASCPFWLTCNNSKCVQNEYTYAHLTRAFSGLINQDTDCFMLFRTFNDGINDALNGVAKGFYYMYYDGETLQMKTSAGEDDYTRYSKSKLLDRVIFNFRDTAETSTYRFAFYRGACLV